MVHYEGVFILNSGLSPDTNKGMVTQIQDLITKNGGRIDGLQEWGRKKLAYRVKKKQDGNYVLINLQIDPKMTKKLAEILRLNDDILRFLFIKKEA